MGSDPSLCAHRKESRSVIGLDEFAAPEAALTRLSGFGRQALRSPERR
jgi:hypothetical protein